MPLETEVKLKIPALEPIRQHLRDLGAQFIGRRLETNTFFDTPDQSLLAADRGLRLRTFHDDSPKPNPAILTYKGPRQPGPFKIRPEIEFSISDRAAAAELFKELGYVQFLSFQKKRESWRLPPCTIELDELPHLGAFLEIEAPSDGPIHQLLKQLNLDPAASIKTGYPELLTTFLRDHRIPSSIVEFPPEQA